MTRRSRHVARGRARRSGMTLVEVMVAGGLLLLLLSVILTTLMPAWRAWMRGERKSDVQQNALVLMARITQEFRSAHASSVYVRRVAARDEANQPVRRDAIIFLSDLDSSGRLHFSPDGEPLWQRRLVFYHDGDSQQVRAIEIPMVPPSTEPEPLLVTGFVASSRDRVVARNVRSFELDWESAPLLRVTVETKRDVHATRFESSVRPLMVSFASPSPAP